MGKKLQKKRISQNHSHRRPRETIWDFRKSFLESRFSSMRETHCFELIQSYVKAGERVCHSRSSDHNWWSTQVWAIVPIARAFTTKHGNGGTVKSWGEVGRAKRSPVWRLSDRLSGGRGGKHLQSHCPPSWSPDYRGGHWPGEQYMQNYWFLIPMLLKMFCRLSDRLSFLFSWKTPSTKSVLSEFPFDFDSSNLLSSCAISCWRCLLNAVSGLI